MQAVGAGLPRWGNSWSERKGQAAEEAREPPLLKWPPGQPSGLPRALCWSADPAPSRVHELLWLDPGQGGCWRCPAKSHPPGSVQGTSAARSANITSGRLARCQRLALDSRGSVGRLGASSPPGSRGASALVLLRAQRGCQRRDQASPTSSFPK